MEKNLEEKVEEALELSRENHKMLRKLYHHMQWSRVFHIFYWILVIGAGIGTYYVLEPYLDSAREVYKNVSEQAQSVSNFFGGDNKGN